MGLIVCGLFVAGLQPPLEEEARKDLARLQGVWLYASSEKDGKPDPAGPRVFARLEFKGTELTQTVEHPVDGRLYLISAIRLDTSASPRLLDITRTGKLQKGLSWEGIYALEGDTLKICLCQTPGLKERPTEFNAPEGSNRRVLALTRATP